jgi:hypothetical protein
VFFFGHGFGRQNYCFPLFLLCFGAVVAFLWGQETASIDPFPIGVALQTYQCQGFNRASGLPWVVSGPLRVSWMVSGSLHVGFKMFKQGFKMAYDDF